MSLRNVFFLVVMLVSVAVVALPGSAQNVPPQPDAASQVAVQPDVTSHVPEGGMPRYIRPETPEQRRERLGTPDDPGINPDLEKVWWRFGKEYKIHRFDRKWARYLEDRPGWVRPLANVNFTEEVYQENDKYVWVWIEEWDPAQAKAEMEAEAAAKRATGATEEAKYFEAIRDEFTPLEPPKSNVRVRFEESSKGLPTSGSWRNSLAVADMNRDGFVDLVLPPQRGVPSAPAIFLGDGQGNWTRWRATWPRTFNYGGVVAADFNKDKNMDLAFAIHLSGVAVFLGDGKGGFREITEGLPSMFPTRRIVTADVDRDGWLDVVTISEGPVGRNIDVNTEGFGSLRAHLNRKKGEAWEAITIAKPREPIGGDYLAVGNFNGDRYPDFVGASVYFNGIHTVYLSKGAKSYEALLDGKGFVVPFRSSYHATAAGRFSSRDRDDAIVAFYRQWPSNLDAAAVAKPPLETVYGIDRISFGGSEPKRTPIARWSTGRAIAGLGEGDMDQDGKLDIVYTRHDPREAALLVGDGKGNFTRGAIEGVTLSALRNYDLTVADVNGDARPDLIIMYESDSSTALAPKNGKVQVFLNRGLVQAE